MTQLSAFGDLSCVASIVLFAGGGGSCTGIEQATGASPLAAVNHCESALRIHSLNHPTTHHCRQDVFSVKPFLLTRGRRLGLLWASPDCTHFSKALGAKPRDNERRGLADVVPEWASTVRPPLIMVENVPDFLSWGPVDLNGRPIKALAGQDFQAWANELAALGYRLEWRILNAADYGVPTIRTRLYLIARCDNQPISWPAPTHGPGQLHPWVAASTCIDLTDIGAPATAERLKPRTWRRINDGLSRLDEPGFSHDHAGGRSFIVVYYGTSDSRSINLPLPTATTHDRFGLVTVTPTGIYFRMLAVREYALSMGFPPDYRLIGTHTEQMRAIGNAVCPPMARELVRSNI